MAVRGLGKGLDALIPSVAEPKIGKAKEKEGIVKTYGQISQ